MVWRQAVRMSVAALAAYFATTLIGIPHGYWAVITCLIIVQGSLGATLSAGLARVAGTVAGALLGGAGALLARLGMPEWIILLLVVAPLALLAAARAIFRMAPFTGALVLLLAGTGSLSFAFSQVAEIGLGTLIGVLASLFVLPERATSVLVERAAATLELLGTLTHVLLSSNDTQAHEKIAIRLRQVYAQLQNDMREVEHERNARLLRSDLFPERLLRHLQRLRTDVNMLGRAVGPEPADAARLELAERISALFRRYAALLRGSVPFSERPPAETLTHEGSSAAPLGFALLTLQLELQALDKTLALREGVGR